MPNVVIVSAQRQERELLTERLVPEFTVTEAADGFSSLRMIFAERPQAVVIDAPQLGMDVLGFIRILHAAADVPILVLDSAVGHVAAARALEAGADDYLRQPFDYAELVARLRSAVRRQARQDELLEGSRVVRTGGLVIDREIQEVRRDGEQVRLTRMEYRLLDTLAQSVGRPVPHQLLLSTVWGPEYVGDSHYLRVYMGYLRRKLEADPRQPRYLLSEWGIGYKLAALPAVATPDAAETNGRLVATG
jgi:two-component system KDP operon response regulator KdpE